MSLCNSFVNQTECILELSNIVQMKLLTLGLLIMFSFAMIYYSDSFNPDEGMFEMWMHHLLGKFPPIFIVFTPLMTLFLLKHSVSYELFIMVVAAIYLVLTGLFIGLSIMFGSLSVWSLLGFKDKEAFNESMRYRETNKKHNN